MPITTPAQLLARMSDLELQTPSTDFMGMFYGPMGGGKSTFVAGLAQTLTQTGKIIYLDSSDGWVSLKNFEGLTSGMTRIRYSNYGDMLGIARALAAKAKGFGEFDVIIIDELSSISQEVLDEVIVEKYHDVNAEPEGKDYRPMGQMMMAALNILHGIEGLHVIVVAHDRDKTDHRKVTTVFPGFSPQLRKNIEKLMHVIGYVSASIKGTVNAPVHEHTVQCQPTGLVSAKSRIGGMPVKCDFPEAVEIISNWVHGDTMAADVDGPEPQVELEADELPTEGIPVADNAEDVDEDDEPVYAGESD